MKYWLLILNICLFPVYSFSQNWFIGGDVRMNRNDIKTEINERTNIGIDISTSIGHKINKFDLGINLNFRYQGQEELLVHDSTEINRKEGFFGIGGGMFTRYSIFSIGKFSILGRVESDYLFNFHINTDTLDYHRIDIKISPVFEYKLLDRLLLYTNFSISGIAYSYIYRSYNSISENIFNVTIPSTLSLGNFRVGVYIIF
ncbi:MAG: hypothetical protein LBH43_15880 [Treponema sp.]|jgi:hypothetical protein|nr:hypothetical protein [Treponema sp.]